jgi:hypothetical protein
VEEDSVTPACHLMNYLPYPICPKKWPDTSGSYLMNYLPYPICPKKWPDTSGS